MLQAKCNKIFFSDQQNTHANLFLYDAPYDFQSISFVGMGDNKNFVSQYIVRVTIAIINIISTVILRY